MFQQLDTLFEEKKIEEVEPFLMEQMKVAMEEGDTSALITILNEMIGYQRDTSQYDKAILYCNQVMKLMTNLGLTQSVHYGTTLINVANAYRAAHRLEESLEYYREVFRLYENQLDKNDFLYASLYNNMSLLYQEMNQYEKAVECLKNALSIVKQHPEKEIQLAVTYGNLGESLLKLNKDDEAMKYLKKAYDIFAKDEEKDFHYSGTLSALGEAYYKKKEYEEAAKCYEEGLRELSSHVGKTEGYYIMKDNLDKVYMAMGKETGHPKGLFLCKSYYEAYGAPMIHSLFPEYENRIAVGLVGEGSECFGFDDAFSEDHDFSAGFCMWLTKEDYEKIGAKLQQEYDKLPDTYMGMSAVQTSQGKGRKGVHIIEEFYGDILQTNPHITEEAQWLSVEEELLCTATNGAVFRDDLGEFTSIRNRLKGYYPDRVYRKRLAKELTLMAQTGQYNYGRMRKRKDEVTAQLILAQFMEHTLKADYLLNRTYSPYYKWRYEGTKKLPKLVKVRELLKEINDLPKGDDKIPVIIEEIASEMIKELQVQHLIAHTGLDNYLETAGKELLKTDRKQSLIDELVMLEWTAFDQVKNQGGRADCQDDFGTFSIMRKSQYMTWTEEMLVSYISDFKEANEKGWNLITEKYGRMMKSTTPKEYEKIKDQLPYLSKEKEAMIEEIVKIQVSWMEEFAEQYPKVAGTARVIHTSEDTPFDTSYETYLRGEISTYSDETLGLYGRNIVSLFKKGENLAKNTMEHTAHLYGYASLEELEEKL